jgi:cardiolipin synthase C
MLIAFFYLFACSHSAYNSLSKLPIQPASSCGQITKEGLPSLDELLLPFKTELEQQKTGIYILEDGTGALASRAWLAEKATTSIDIQYFIFSSDNVGLMATHSLLQAAKRGVYVRLLVDDTLAHGDSDLLFAVNAHPNFEVRIYNPNINIGKNIGHKITNVISDFRGINQRMHNKTFTVDGQISITGGRNVGDEYYDLDTEYNFRDRDILLVGDTVKDIQTSFNEFWNHPISVPIDQLLPEDTVKNPEILWSQLHRYACDTENISTSFISRVNNIPLTINALSKSEQILWESEVYFVSDRPGKNKSDTLGGGGISTSALIDLIQQAESRVLIQTPYLILTKNGLDLFSAVEKKDVEITILTNSLSATDGILAFAGYKSIRNDLIRMGVDLYESKPHSVYNKELNTSQIEKTKEAPIGLHAKSMLIDEDIVMVGSYNLDPRSANLNTECIVIVHSKRLNKMLSENYTNEIEQQNAWKITLAQNPDNEANLTRRALSVLLQFMPKSIL